MTRFASGSFERQPHKINRFEGSKSYESREPREPIARNFWMHMSVLIALNSTKLLYTR